MKGPILQPNRLRAGRALGHLTEAAPIAPSVDANRPLRYTAPTTHPTRHHPMPPSNTPQPGDPAAGPASLAALERCREAAPPLLAQAAAQFNAGQFYACHETLEVLWQAETGPLRELYQGILQVGVGCHHALRGNARGATSLLRRGIARLRPLPPLCQGVRVAVLTAAAERCLAAIEAGQPLTLAACPRVEFA